MEKKDIEKALKELRENSPKRNFKQSIDIIVKLKDLDIKKVDNQLEFFIGLHYSKGKKIKVCALVGPELKDEATKICDKTITQDEFKTFDKKAIKKLADEYDIFIAQANIMGKVASAFGRVLGPRNKMPNPKAGCVIPPKASLKPLYEKIQKMIKVTTKKSTVVQCSIANENMKEEEIIDNIQTIYKGIEHHLPNEKNNVKEVMIKFTMSKPVNLAH